MYVYSETNRFAGYLTYARFTAQSIQGLYMESTRNDFARYSYLRAHQLWHRSHEIRLWRGECADKRTKACQYCREVQDIGHDRRIQRVHIELHAHL